MSRFPAGSCACAVSWELRHPGSEEVRVVPIARDRRWYLIGVLPDDPVWIELGERVVPVAQP